MFDNGIVPDYISQLTAEQRQELNAAIRDAIYPFGYGYLKITMHPDFSVKCISPQPLM